MVNRPVTAFVLGGGGARGALQVGALRALLEAGLQPDLLAGTSIGAANATFVAMHGFTAGALDALEAVWHDAARRDLLPDNYVWLTVRALFNRAGLDVGHRIRDFFVGHGLDPDLRFGQLPGPRLTLVAADLKAGGTVLYGSDPDGPVLNAVLASTAIPPWVRPLAREGRLLMDGGVVSNLPIEPALAHGATAIVALDLADPRLVGPQAAGLGPFLFQLVSTVEQRQVHLEKQLAAARGVPVHHVRLQPETPVAVWDFGQAVPLLERGYSLARRYLAEHPELARSEVPWWRRLWPWR
jgi:NTE family protein